MNTVIFFNSKREKGYLIMIVIYGTSLYLLDWGQEKLKRRDDIDLNNFLKFLNDSHIFDRFDINLPSLSLDNIYKEIPELLL